MTQILLTLSIVCIGIPVYGILSYIQLNLRKRIQMKLDRDMNITFDDIVSYCIITFFRWGSIFGTFILSVNLWLFLHN